MSKFSRDQSFQNLKFTEFFKAISSHLNLFTSDHVCFMGVQLVIRSILKMFPYHLYKILLDKAVLPRNILDHWSEREGFTMMREVVLKEIQNMIFKI